MKEVIDCAYCAGKAHLQKENGELEYRKENFKVVEHFYECDKCHEEFTTTESDTVTLLQAHNQYREIHHIPFPEEIISIRDKYGLSAKKMSEVLGLGINGYSNYEKGEIPKPAIGNLISTAEDPSVFKNMLIKAEECFSAATFEKTLRKVDSLIEDNKKPKPFYYRLNQYDFPSNFTGFKKLNKDKIANILICFIKTGNNDFNDRLKLNKLLFYTDFYAYRLFGYSITGLTYRAIDYGPVPTFYDNLYTYLENEEMIESKWVRNLNSSGKEVFITNKEYDKSLFTNEEILVLEKISEKFKNTSSWDLVELSHKEQSWIDLNKKRDLINYQNYAFGLLGV